MASCTAFLLMLCLFVPCSSLYPAAFSQLSSYYIPRRTPKVAPAKNNNYIPYPDEKPNTPAPSTYTPNVKVDPTPKTKSPSNNPSSDPYWPPGPDFPPFYNDIPEEPIFDPFEHNPNLDSWYGSDNKFGSVQLPSNYKPTSKPVTPTPFPPNYRPQPGNKPDKKPSKNPVLVTPAPSTYTPNVKIDPTPKTKSPSNNPSSEPYWPPGPDFPPFYNDVPEEPIFDPYENNPNLDSWYDSGVQFYNYTLGQSKPYKGKTDKDSRPAGNDGPRVPSKVNPPSSGSGARPSTSTHTPSYVNPSPPEYSDSRPPAGFVIPSLTVYTGTKSPVYATPTPTSYINPRGTGLSNGSPQSGDYKPPGYPNPIPPAGYVLPTPTSYTNPRGTGLSNGSPQSGDYKPPGYPNPIPPAGYVLPTPTSYTNPRGAGLSNGNPQSGDYKPPGYPNPIPPAGYVIPTPTSYVNPSQPSYRDYKPPGYPNLVPPAGYLLPTPTSYVNPSPPRYGDSNPSGYSNPLPPAGYIVPNPQGYVPPSSRYPNPQPTVYPSPAPSGYDSGRPPAGYVTDRPSAYVPPAPSSYTKPTPPGYNNANPVVGYGESKPSGYDGPSVSGLSNSKPSPSVAGYGDYKPSEDRNPPSSEYGTEGPSGYERQEDVYTDSEDNYESFYLTADDPNYYFILEQYGLEEDPCEQRGKVFTFSSSCSTYFTCENDSNGRLLGIRLNDCGDNSSYDIAQRKCVADAYCTAGCPDASHVKPANNAYKFLNGGYVQDCPRSLYFNFQSCTCEGLDIY